MYRLERRLSELEDRVKEIQRDPAEEEFKEFLAGLSTDELRWLLDPLHAKERLVPCPHAETVECGCRSDERARRALEAFPEIEEEYVRHRQTLVERVGERPKNGGPWRRGTP